MARSGRKTIIVDAPVMITSNKIAVWLDEKWIILLGRTNSNFQV
jgi:hypothetical protein